MKHSLKITFLLLSFISCTNVKQIAKGELSDNKTYNFYFYNYIYVSSNSKNLFKNCKVYMTHIKNSHKKIEEIIFWYSCDTVLPIKYFVTSDSLNGLAKSNFLIADTTTNYLISITEDERQVFDVTNKYLSGEGHPTYLIKGFRPLSQQDSLVKAPFLKTTIKYYRK
jgi:hypothetical protein